MKTILSFLTIIYLTGCGAPQQNTSDQDSTENLTPPASEAKMLNIAGTYTYGKDAEKEAIGRLMIYPKDDTTVLFNIDVSVGPPSYNSGQLYDTLAVKNNQAIYQLNEEGSKGCKWQVNFLGDSIVIKTLDNAYDCGFGGNVIADSTYKLVGHKVPEYFIGREGDTTYFNK